MTEFLLLTLLLIVNGAPILARWGFRERFAYPLDFGLKGMDERPLLGRSKTWRGLFAAVTAAVLFAELFGFGVLFGLIFGLVVMLGDLIASYIKRRLNLQPSDQAIGLDQIPESLIPLIFANLVLDFGWLQVLLLTIAFFILELMISKPLYWLKIRRRPY